ncbi:MAG: repeat-containing protein [Amycolatopsis sp.]|uniref:DUF6531 domain-containing protein n=1 Tax=Amycolatopsis sp. TaxID=37632 RepID=UPI00262FFF0C|nr:DUF6531 domain-containing protein [Amycolatopsis sp.]MCU1679765.1 repeat-containing protein [Amycolatopsis sp.]
MGNPLVAPVQDSTKGYSGISLVESAESLKQGIESGDWASIAMGAVGTALDALSAVMDPFGAILAAGVGWLLEHVGPLKEALNALTGDADQISANSETWKNIATELSGVGDDLKSMVAADTASWMGDAGDAYRQRSTDTVALLQAASKGCEGASSGVKTAGEVVAAVRTLVRDTIAQLVGHLISWALQVLFTLGIGLAWVVPEVIAAVAKTASEIAKVTKGLVKALKALMPLMKNADKLFGDAASALKKIKPGEGVPKAKHGDVSSGPKPMDPPNGKSDSTSLSGDHSGDKPQPPPSSKDPGSTTSSAEHGGNGDESTGSSATNHEGNGSGDKSAHKPGDTSGDTPSAADAKSPDTKECVTDPVDVATGDVLLTEVDLRLPTVLASVLERTYLSSYSHGGWFGANWASTVDERVEVHDGRVRYFTADGAMLHYSMPEPGVPVRPVVGPMHELTLLASGGFSVRNPRRRTISTFTRTTSDHFGLSVVEHAEGESVIVDRDDQGTPLRLRHSTGPVLLVDTAEGRVRAVRLADGGQGVLVAAYSFDEAGRLTGVTNSSGVPKTFAYDAAGRMTGWQDRTGAQYHYVYDGSGRCVRTIGEGGFLNGTLVYEERLTHFTDSLANTARYRFDEHGNLIERTDPLGHTTLLSSNSDGLLLNRTDPLGATTSFAYDRDGLCVAVLRADGSRVTLLREDDGTVVTEVRDGERSYRRTYSADAMPDPLVDPIGVAGAVHYEDLSTADTQAAAATASSGERDIFGRTAHVVDAAGSRTGFSWTVEGQRLARHEPSGATWRWTQDAEGSETGELTPAGRWRRTQVGVFGMPVAETAADGAVTTREFDTELRLIRVTTPLGLDWRYEYDPAGRVVSETDYDGRTLTYTHDSAGNLVRTVNGAGQVTEYRYDQLGQLISRDCGGDVTSYRYDPLGRLIGATEPGCELVLVRDDDGTLLAEVVNGHTTSYHRDESGRVVHRRTPSGVDTDWTYDSAGNPATVTGSGCQVVLRCDPDGLETERSINGFMVLSHGYGAGRRLDRQSFSDGAGYSVRYAPDGKLTDRTNPLQVATTYRRDPAGRIVEAGSATGSERFDYDPLGNVVAAHATGLWAANPENGPRAYTANTVVAAGSVRYQHDRQGRQVRRQVVTDTGALLVWQYGWDSRDRLVAVDVPDGSRWHYGYDPLGRRISKVRRPAGREEPAERTDFFWDGLSLAEQVRVDPAGTRHITTWDRHPSTGAPLLQADRFGATDRPEHVAVHTVVTDQIGTPTELLDPAGRVAWSALSSVWGRVVARPGARATTPLRFPGQYADAETGLHYNVFRFYDPGLGRYLSQDPQGLGPAANPAAYVPDPLADTDPLGLACDKKSGGDKPATRGHGGGDSSVGAGAHGGSKGGGKKGGGKGGGKPGGGGEPGGSRPQGIPDEAWKSAQWIKDHQHNGTETTGDLKPYKWQGTEPKPGAPDGSTYGGKTYANHPATPGGKPQLPTGVDYHEYDVHPIPKFNEPPGGQVPRPDRTPESGAQGGRLVFGSDGSVHYSDHYDGFQTMHGPRPGYKPPAGDIQHGGYYTNHPPARPGTGFDAKASAKKP